MIADGVALIVVVDDGLGGGNGDGGEVHFIHDLYHSESKYNFLMETQL